MIVMHYKVIDMLMFRVITEKELTCLYWFCIHGHTVYIHMHIMCHDTYMYVLHEFEGLCLCEYTVPTQH